ncbi:hypothetical protein TD95_003025 [Thielaviopsis punctulata]|uniref:DNA-directed RNA polymerases I, II, and III subunit RPABC3 n=1 Tax=Thielaviopsis punctulata TaxID=72032 RepID=A0A0F4ZEJ0_9PEZI|nr:hypothetical protein TD95_003025 [Thielaviopsis punctulata]
MSGNGSDATLFEEGFTVTEIDQSKYDRVARISAKSADESVVLTLDINVELLTLAVGQNISVMIATSLALDGSKSEEKGWRDPTKGNNPPETTLADLYDYVCYGKIYKFEDGDDGKNIKVYASFGGLLLSLDGPYKKLTSLRVDYIYFLLKK